MKVRKPIKHLQVKMHVTDEEKEKLKARADDAGLSLSLYLSTVGLGRQTGVAAERSRDLVNLLEMALSRLTVISQEIKDDGVDTLIVYEKLCEVERMIIMLAASASIGNQP